MMQQTAVTANFSDSSVSEYVRCDPAELVDVLSRVNGFNICVVKSWDSRDWISTGSVPATVGQCSTFCGCAVTA